MPVIGAGGELVTDKSEQALFGFTDVTRTNGSKVYVLPPQRHVLLSQTARVVYGVPAFAYAPVKRMER